MRLYKQFIPAFLIGIFLFAAYFGNAQQLKNWTPDQFVNPALLANSMIEKKALPYIFSIGPMALTLYSIDIGADTDVANLISLKEAINKLPKDAEVVIYCGCCPFNRCPNLRPAIELFKEMNFKNFHLLNLAMSIKADWIDK